MKDELSNLLSDGIENTWTYILQALLFFLIDSTVLAYIMKTLNERHNYGLNLVLLSIDEGITGYRDDSLEVCVLAMTILPSRQ